MGSSFRDSDLCTCLRIMWYEFEPLLTSGKLRSTTPASRPNPNPKYFPRFHTNSHSSSFIYPSCQSYISGMNDYHYYYNAQGFKLELSPPAFKLNFPNSFIATGPVHLRWTK